MTDPKKPTPVAILIAPRMDLGHPSCGECPFLDSEWGCIVDREDQGEDGPIPGKLCPVHGPPETRAKPF